MKTRAHFFALALVFTAFAGSALAAMSPEKQKAFELEQSRKVREIKPIETKSEPHPEGKSASDFQQLSLTEGLAVPSTYRARVGCEEVLTFYGLTQIDTRIALSREASDLYELYRTMCMFTYSDGATVRYPNGTVATYWANQVGATWYYPNGTVATYWAGEDTATWYYSNRRIVSNWAIRPGSTWYYPNGNVATDWARQNNVTWFYSERETITSRAGVVGASWRWSNGATISNSMGTSSPWYRRDGSVLYSQGAILSASQLADVPQIFLLYLGSGQVLPDLPWPGTGGPRQVRYANFADMIGGETFFEVWGSFLPGDIPRAECCPSSLVSNGNCTWRSVRTRRTFPTTSVASSQINFALPQIAESQTCRFSIGSAASPSDTTEWFPLRVPALGR